MRVCWYLDEPHLTLQSLSEHRARTQHFKLLATRLTKKLDSTFPNQFELIIDAGAGTGASTKPLREVAAEIIGLDFSRPMLIQNDSKHRLQVILDYYLFRQM